MTAHLELRRAEVRDVPAIATLLVEGFGQHYGGVLQHGAGQQLYERMYAVWPERLAGVLVAVDGDNRPIGMAGLRTQATQPPYDPRTIQVMRAALGPARLVQYQLGVRLLDPPPYPVQPDEAYVHSMTVTAAWQGRGVAAALLDGLHAQAYDLNKRWMVVEIEEHNVAARRVYARAGYAVRHRRRGLLAWLPWGASPRLLLAHRLETERARMVGVS